MNYNLYNLICPWIKDIIILNHNYNLSKYNITDIVLHSNLVTKGSLFIAVSGYNTHGYYYIKSAIENGAQAIIIEFINNNYINNLKYYNNIPIILFKNLKLKLSALAGRFFNQPSKKIKLVGVTGTNGKTTITNLISQWTHLLGENSAVMSTIGNGIIRNNYLLPTYNTTMSSIDIQRQLLNFVLNGVKFVTLEISSHGIVQNRINDLDFNAAVFSNISHDHLDYHGNMKQYILSKWQLFNKFNIYHNIINIDDVIGKIWAKKISNVSVVSINKDLSNYYNNYWLYTNNILYTISNTNIKFRSFWGDGSINTKLIGEFNAMNVLLALTTLLSLGYSLQELINTAKYLKPIVGRMEIINLVDCPIVIIDYAHNPEALKKLLLISRSYCNNKLWCIFGCGGERDKKKRPIMGYIANNYADISIVTSDNPRNELLSSIINDIKSGMNNVNIVKIITDRSQAITYAINNANKNDVIVIAGKGHENYQIIKNNYFCYSDKFIVNNLLKK
ncbi:MAG: UDP-N-acetylmuramoyl-L-alanyl-D-glutamate--2,6-diaminopimelate ligase [Candidatus Lightella neohaematopini]|nr:UDP-N-acetylmuramoyl-L-alanyl-D-glutamate--2,6-diaminopimelate ligase [Candidatus Lightella neohaematopini]